MVGFVIQDEDVFQAHQFGHDPLDHLAFRLKRVDFFARPALEKLAAASGYFHPIARFERVVIGDDDLGPLQVGQHVGGDEFAGFVIAVGIVGLEHAQPVLDGESGSDNEESPREGFAVRAANGVDGLPGDNHRHHGCLACAGCQFQGETREPRIGVIVSVGEMVKESRAAFTETGGDLREPNKRFGCFDLTEERPDRAECMVAPVVEEAGCLWSDQPLFGISELSPFVDENAKLIDNWRWVVLLLFCRDALALVKHHLRLRAFALALARLGDGRNELSGATSLD